jgi:hypothetical protein
MWDGIAPVVPVITAFGGYWLAGRNEEKRDQRALAREDISRRAARAERLSDERHEIQRQTLFDLQDELVHLASFTSRIVMFDRRNPGRTRDGKAVPLPDEPNQGFADKMRSVQRLRSRVLDCELRESVVAFIAVCTNATMIDATQSPEELVASADRKIQDLANTFPPLNERLGRSIRGEIDRLGDADSDTATHPRLPRWRRWLAKW